jgi:predicted enzyme related to lactoylglutathione lyase
MPRAKTGPGGLRSIRSVIYPVTNMETAKAFYSVALDREPYFDQPRYCGFDIDGQELGLFADTDERKPGSGGAVAYWRVDDIVETCRRLCEIGATQSVAVKDVGGGMLMAIVSDPFGNDLGLISHD